MGSATDGQRKKGRAMKPSGISVLQEQAHRVREGLHGV